MSTFAYDQRFIVMCEGSEVLVHDASTEGPLFRFDAGSAVVAVGISASEILAITAGGDLVRSALDGSKQHRTATGAPVNHAALCGADWMAASDEVVLINGQSIPVAQANALAWAPDGGTAAIAVGNTVSIHGGDGSKQRTFSFESNVTSVASHRGEWLVGVGPALYRTTGDGFDKVTNAGDMSILRIATDSAGGQLAVQLTETLVLVMAYPSRDTVGQVNYGDKVVHGFAFGPTPWLGIGLSGGDGNKIDLTSGAVCRTDTHPGREHHSWLLSVSVEPPTDAAAPPVVATPAGPPIKGVLIAAAIVTMAIVAVLVVMSTVV